MKTSGRKKHRNEEKSEGTSPGLYPPREKSLCFSSTSDLSVMIRTKSKVQFQQRREEIENTLGSYHNTECDLFILSLKIKIKSEFIKRSSGTFSKKPLMMRFKAGRRNLDDSHMHFPWCKSGEPVLLKLVGQGSQWDVMLPDTPGVEGGAVCATLM